MLSIPSNTTHIILNQVFELWALHGKESSPISDSSPQKVSQTLALKDHSRFTEYISAADLTASPRHDMSSADETTEERKLLGQLKRYFSQSVTHRQTDVMQPYIQLDNDDSLSDSIQLFELVEGVRTSRCYLCMSVCDCDVCMYVIYVCLYVIVRVLYCSFVYLFYIQRRFLLFSVFCSSPLTVGCRFLLANDYNTFIVISYSTQ